MHTNTYIHICFEVTHLVTMVNTEVALDPAHNMTLRILYTAIQSLYHTLDALHLYAIEYEMQTLILSCSYQCTFTRLHLSSIKPLFPLSIISVNLHTLRWHIKVQFLCWTLLLILTNSCSKIELHTNYPKQSQKSIFQNWTVFIYQL